MSDDWTKIRNLVDAAQGEPQEPFGFIQWKGTDVCIDLYCQCGYHGHCDEGFFYYYECPACHKRYAVGDIVRLVELPNELHDYVKNRATGFHSCIFDPEWMDA